jgi:hypothetical protein
VRDWDLHGFCHALTSALVFFSVDRCDKNWIDMRNIRYMCVQDGSRCLMAVRKSASSSNQGTHLGRPI